MTMRLNICLQPLVLKVLLCLAVLVVPACHKAGLQPAAGPHTIRSPEQTTAAAVPERVSFDSLDRDPATGKPVVIQALLFKPAGADRRRVPAVVALHGCGGMYSTREIEAGHAVHSPPDDGRPAGCRRVCGALSRQLSLARVRGNLYRREQEANGHPTESADGRAGCAGLAAAP